MVQIILSPREQEEERIFFFLQEQDMNLVDMVIDQELAEEEELEDLENQVGEEIILLP